LQYSHLNGNTYYLSSITNVASEVTIICDTFVGERSFMTVYVTNWVKEPKEYLFILIRDFMGRPNYVYTGENDPSNYPHNNPA
jgi:hypothetical protein